MPSVIRYDRLRHNLWYGCNIRFTDYETVKARYETTVPLRGAWRKQFNVDVRPATVRRRKWEIWHKDGDAYGLAFCQAYAYGHYDSTTKKQVYTSVTDNRYPLIMIHPDGQVDVHAVWFNSYTTLDMLAAALPKGITLVKYGSKAYLEVKHPDGNPRSYFLYTSNKNVPQKKSMTFIPYEIDGVRYYDVHDPMQEYKYVVHRGMAKAARAEAVPFITYYNLMRDLIAPSIIDHENKTVKGNWQEKRDAKQMLEEGRWLYRKDGEEFGEHWADAVEAIIRAESYGRYVNKGTRDQQDFQFEVFVPDHVYVLGMLSGSRLYKLTRPFTAVPVPIGTPFCPNGR